MAAVTVSQIVKEALTEIKNRHLMLTPENYTDVFNEISKKYGFSTEESRKIEKYISRLGSEYKNQALSLNIKTVDEFVAFMTARLGRSMSATKTNEDSTKANQSLNAFARRILQAVSILHNKDAKALAEQGMQLLAKKYDSQMLDTMRERWFDFVSSYNDEYLGFLKYYGVKSFDDLREMSKELENFLTVKNENSGIASITELFIKMLEPSITTELGDNLDELTNIIKKNPLGLSEQDLQDKISSFVDLRIEKDRAEIKEKIGSLNIALENIGDKISDIATSSKTSSLKIQDIQNNLKDVTLSKTGIEQIRTILLNVASALEVESREFSDEMNKKQQTISELKERVSSLEKELEAAKLESKEDFLTKVATKRALMNELQKIEEAYKRYGIDYSLCFVDIDFFKKINDGYGHDAGDVILSAVAQLLKKHARKIDFIGRYGGEEFIVLLPNTNLNSAVKFADKIRSVIEGFKFIYKNDRIKVTISAGVATRSANISETLTLESADKMLYSSKQNGRNQVMPKIIE